MQARICQTGKRGQGGGIRLSLGVLLKGYAEYQWKLTKSGPFATQTE